MSYRKFLRSSRRLTAVAVLLLLLALLGGFSAVRDAAAASSTWDATYWNNKTLTGTPVLQRQENEINYDWGDGSRLPQSTTNSFRRAGRGPLPLLPAPIALRRPRTTACASGSTTP